MNRLDYEPTNNVGICELHFREQDINRPEIGRASLIKGAVPFLSEVTQKHFETNYEDQKKENREKVYSRENEEASSGGQIIEKENKTCFLSENNQLSVVERPEDFTPLGDFDKLLSIIKYGF